MTRFALTVAALLIAAPAAAEPATVLGTFGNWSAFQAGTGANQSCYALSKPRASRPAAKRGKIYLLVSDWPARHVKGEPQIFYGYQAKENGVASLGVGPDKFNFFLKNTGKDGSAWLQTPADNNRLGDAMGKGVSAVATGTSARGTKTTDTYGLAGFPDAIAKVHAACGM